MCLSSVLSLFMYFLFLFLPFLNIFLNNLFLGSKSSLLSIFLFSFQFFLLFFILSDHNDLLLLFSSWFSLGPFHIQWIFRFDSLTRVMILPIILVSFLVQLYSHTYLSNDPHKTRYFSYLNLFTFKMLILVTADNLLLLFIGWEGVGLASYLLVNFWFTRIAANMASLKAFFMNRLGDWG